MATLNKKYPQTLEDSFDFITKEDKRLLNDRSVLNLQRPKKSYVGLIIPLVIVFILAMAWVIIRPGVFTIQPIGNMPQGVTVIYFSRAPGVPLFSSPEGLCLKSQGSISLDCSMVALNTAAELSNRIILQLPFNQWAYLKSMSGVKTGQ